MTTFGEIVLKFGATGAEGEEPLRFKTAHINLVVGPNNAGKSLMLRELSGVNPRANKRLRIGWESEKYPPTRIIDAVHWDDSVAQPVRQEIIDEKFSITDLLWSEIKARLWDRLVPGLENAATELESIRDQLCATLVGQARATFWSWSMAASNEYLSDTKRSAPLVVSGALILLNRHRLDSLAVAGTASSAEGSGARQSGERLTDEQAAAMRQAFEEAGARLEPVLQSLDIDTHGLTTAQILDPTAFGAAILTALSADSLYHSIIRNTGLSQIPRASDAEAARAQRLIALASWLLDPQPLRQVARQLRDEYNTRTWADHAQREQLAKQVLYLDGVARLSVTRSAELKAFDDEDGGQPAILALLKDPEAMDLLRTLTVNALDAYLVLDIVTRGEKVIWRLAQEEPPKGLETSYTREAREFHKAAARLDARSDGIHAFVGMLAAIVAKPIDLVFIDEPEAFLHPPLVRRLARQLAFLALDADKQFFIATHSADLLEAFVSGGAEVNIIRLTHDRERSTARLLNSADLRHLARDPLLRSEATLSALFHDGAVICEAAGDRVLYKEIHERLLNAEDDDALESCVFLNAQNWETVRRMMAPLRRMGVAAAAIVDADVLFEPELTRLLDAAQVEKVIRDGWIRQREGLRKKITERFDAELLAVDPDVEVEAAPEPSDGNKKKQKLAFKGPLIAKLNRGERKIFDNLLASMAEYGVFLVPVGELENWLSPLGLEPPKDRAMKAKWLREALERLGQDPRSKDYVRPADGDIWDFMRRVNAWILDPDREGTSSTTQMNNEGGRA